MGKIIAAIRNTGELKSALESRAEIVFMISTKIEELKEQIELVHKNGKKLFAHIFMIQLFKWWRKLWEQFKGFWSEMMRVLKYLQKHL